MKFSAPLLLTSTFVGVSIAASATYGELPLVNSKQLQRILTRSALLKHAEKLQSFADQDPKKNRGFGGTGHNLTVQYLYDTLSALDYYNVSLQEFVWEYADGSATFAADGTDYPSVYFTYSPSTNGSTVSGDLVAVANLGCDITDYPPELSGAIALISRGTCEFGLKTAYAGAAGAVGAIIYNNLPGSISGGTLSAPTRPEGPYVPVAAIAQEDGLSLLENLQAGATIVGELSIDSVLENRTTHNVIATSKIGDQSNVIVSGGHTDSVGAGPGINDDGSGSLGLLEIAIQLPKWSVKNAVRFTFWSAEEFGLVGSKHYVASLSEEEQSKITLYLNFDMIASPNYVYFIYDGDGDTFNVTGPAGSAEIEHLFEDYFRAEGLQTKPTEFDGRSDYGPFLSVGIPSGGLFTGAEGVKTAEEAAIWGGVAGEWYDPNYHKKGDTIKNLDMDAWLVNTKAVAHAIATYARSTDSIPKRSGTKKSLVLQRQNLHAGRAHGSHCGHVI
ncbi:Leucyl aminopeptidase yscIV, partial [Rhizina undulata]